MPIDHDLLRILVPPPLDPEEWKQRLRAHEEFLHAIGSTPWGCGWQVLDLSGLPLAVWEGPRAEEGVQLNLNIGNLEGLSLQFARLACAAFPGVHGPAVSFRGADLSHALLTDALLDGADFSSATMNHADLSRSSLRSANFRRAMLVDADFENCDLTGANFRGANVRNARFDGATLDAVVGLPTPGAE